MDIKKLLKMDWEIIAGIVAAVVVIVLKLLHLVQEETMLTLAIVLLAGLFLREIRRESVFDKFSEDLAAIQANVQQLTADSAEQGSVLVTPAAMYDATSAFSRQAKGVCVFKHVSPFMFKRDAHFESFLKPMLDRDSVTEIIFIIEEDQKEDFDRYVRSKTDKHEQAAKVAEPILADNGDGNGIIAHNCGLSESFEALITFFSEPFMTKYRGNWVPKFAMHVLPSSDVAKSVSDNVRKYLTFN